MKGVRKMVAEGDDAAEGVGAAAAEGEDGGDGGEHRLHAPLTLPQIHTGSNPTPLLLVMPMGRADGLVEW